MNEKKNVVHAATGTITIPYSIRRETSSMGRQFYIMEYQLPGGVMIQKGIRSNDPEHGDLTGLRQGYLTCPKRDNFQNLPFPAEEEKAINECSLFKTAEGELSTEERIETARKAGFSPEEILEMLLNKQK